MSRKPASLLTLSVPEDPALDAALSEAVLHRVADGADPALRLARPAASVSFGRLDRLAPGFPAAVAAARARGFEPVLRVGGGRAAAIHEETVVFGIAEPASDAIAARFAVVAELARDALRRLGADARIGALAGEYCPGEWSVHAGGVKLVGVAQRMARRTAWTDGFVVVRDGARLRAVLADVYEELGLAWEPATAGALDDVLPGVSSGDVAAALRAEMEDRFDLRDVDADAALLSRAEALRERHVLGADQVRQDESPA